MAKREKQVNAPEAGTVTQTDSKAMVAAVQSSALMTSAPDWLQAEMGGANRAGFENIDAADIILPRLAIANSTSPEFLDRESGIDLGDVFDNLGKQVLARAGEGLEVIPLVIGKSRIRFEKPQPPSPILCRSLDGKKASMKGGMLESEEVTDQCERCVYKTFSDDEKPKCTEFLTVLLMVPSLNFAVYAASFKSTGLKVVRRFISQAMTTGAPLFAGKYVFKTKEYSNGAQKWWNWDYEAKGWVAKDEYARAKAQYSTFQDKTWAPSDLGNEGSTEEAGDTNFPPAETVEASKGATTSDNGF